VENSSETGGTSGRRTQLRERLLKEGGGGKGSLSIVGEGVGRHGLHSRKKRGGVLRLTAKQTWGEERGRFQKIF